MKNLLKFPVTPFGQCNEGVKIMEKYYKDRGIPTQIYYTKWVSNEYPGHVWLKVENKLIDSYYGPIEYEGQYGFSKWFSPDKIFNNFQELISFRLDHPRG